MNLKSEIRNIRSKLTEACGLRSELDRPPLELIGIGHERTWAQRDPSGAISDFGFEIQKFPISKFCRPVSPSVNAEVRERISLICNRDFDSDARSIFQLPISFIAPAFDLKREIMRVVDAVCGLMADDLNAFSRVE